MTTFEARVRKMTTKAAVVHLAMTVAVVVYAVVVFVMQQQWDAPPAQEPPPAVVFLAIATIAAGISLWMRSRLPPADGSGPQEWRQALDAGSAQDKSLAADISGMSQEEQVLSGFAVHVTTQLILVWAMAESVAIIGMVRAFLARNAMDLAPYVIVSLMILLITTPKLAQRVAEARSAVALGSMS